MYTYVHRPGCKKENTATYVYIQAGSRSILAHTYDEGSCTWLGRNGETASSSCSWGGNGMRRVHGEGCGVPQNGGNGPPTVETGVLLIGRGVAYRKTDETDLPRSKRGSCSSGGVWRTTKRDSTGYCSSPPSTSSSLHGLVFIQPPPRATPQATVQPPLHSLLFIQPSTP